MKRLIVTSPGSTDKDVAATFRLRDGRVEIQAPQDTIAMFSLDEIGEDLTPDDGQEYYDALDTEVRGTYCYIETVPDDEG